MSVTDLEWTIGDRMAKARRVAKISTPAMCEFLGIHRNSLNAYEHDRSQPPLAVLRLWAQQCDVELDWLRYGDDPPRPQVVAMAAKRKRRSSSTRWLTTTPALVKAA